MCFISVFYFSFDTAAATEVIHDFDIPPLPLNDALNKVSDISEVSFLVSYDLVDNKKGKPVKGQYTTQQALNVLLKGTGFKGELTDHEVFLIRPVSVASIDNSNVSTPTPPKKSLFATALEFLFPVGTVDSPANSQDTEGALQDDVEQISVTGSYIKKKSYNEVGSPIDFIGRIALDADAPNGRLVDLLRFLPMNSGNFSGLAPGGDGGAQEGRLGAGTVDIRGLGGGATLVLLNGQRQAGFPLAFDGRVDVNSLVPGIMLSSVEVLKDGASAVYGSDAVAGVVNFITRSDFEGLEFRIDGRGTYGATVNPLDHYSSTIGVLFGSSKSQPANIVAGVEYFKQDNLVFGEVEQVPVFTSRGASSFGNPGSYVIPVRDEAGAIVNNQTVADPFCQDVIGANISNDPNFSQTPTSLDSAAKLCRVTFPNQAFLLDEERLAGRVEFQWEINENLTFNNTLGFTRSIAKDIFNATTPVLDFPRVSGEHPNNPFVAMDNNGEQLFAQDANGDGIADRDADNAVILDPNGIAFNEDVLFRGRPYSATNYGVVAAEQELNTFRIGTGFNGLVDDWSWNLGWNYSRQELIRRGPDSVFSELQSALNGNGGPTGDLYFNPFGSSILEPAAANDPILAESIQVMLYDQHVTETTTLDGVISGDLFDLPAGSLSTAFGFQVRSEKLDQDFDYLKNISQVSFFGNGDVDFIASEKVTAVFFEVVIPVTNSTVGNLDLSVAGRYENNLDTDSRTFNPKFSMHYRTDLFSLNGSYATSFLAPSLFQTGGVTAQFANVDDPVSGTSEQVSTRIIGNKDLKDQESTSISFGVNFTPTDNFTINLSYWNFDFSDLISASLTQTIVTADPNGPLVNRNGAGIISLVERPLFNAGAIETDGVDFKVNYEIPTDNLGYFMLEAQGTFVSRYDVQDEKGGVTIDGVGSDNNGNIGAAMAEWRTNARVIWRQDNHSSAVTARYYSDVERIRGSAQGIAEATWVFDAQYSYLFETKTADILVTLGARNILNNEPNIVLTTDNQYFVGTYQDPAGRVLYASAKVNF
jgi:outer membrane receptor for ferrienterochelin and colicin